MARLNGNQLRCNLPKLVLVLLLIYFSQVYPYVHFHHSHDDDLIPVHVSLHPVGVDVEDFCDHHEDGHHHHTFDQGTDTYAVRTGTRYVLNIVDVPVLVGGLRAVPLDEPRSYSKEHADDALPDAVPVEASICRGPPTHC